MREVKMVPPGIPSFYRSNVDQATKNIASAVVLKEAGNQSAVDYLLGAAAYCIRTVNSGLEVTMAEATSESWIVTSGPASPYYGVAAQQSDGTLTIVGVRMTDANARRIAAVPEMEDAIEALLSLCIDYSATAPEQREEVKQARAVLAKARGQD